MVSYLKNCTNSSTIIVAASDSPRLDAADFVCSGSDDQDDINAIIADLPTTGGRVYFLNGTYSIDTYTYDARIDRYYGLYVAHGDDTHCQISLEGETSPWTNSFPDCTYDSSGVRFITSPTSNAFTTYGTNTYGTYALGVQGYTHTFPDVNTGIELEVKNMAFILPAQIGNHGGVDFGGIGGGVSRYIADSLVATVDVPYASLASPPAYSIGFLSVPGQNAAAVPISNCFAYGFYFGFNLCGEHHIATADYARFCTYPFLLGSGPDTYHPNVMVGCGESECINGVWFGNSTVSGTLWDLINYNIEYYSTADTYWTNTAFERAGSAIESTPSWNRGLITYGGEDLSVGDYMNIPFWEPGHGTMFRTIAGDSVTIGGVAQRPTYPYIGQVYIDLEIDVANGIPLWWNGAIWIDATGTDRTTT